MRILFFGIYSTGSEYPRNHNLIRGLQAHGFEVLECHFRLAASFRKRIEAVNNPLQRLRFFLGLVGSFIALTFKFIRTPPVDAIIVGHPGYFHIHLVYCLRRIFRKKTPLIYDVFIPLCDAVVEDRGLLRSGGLQARLLQRFEGSGCKLADVCLMDTQAHCRYLSSEFNLPPQNVLRVFVGPTIRDTFDHPAGTRQHPSYTVLYVGTYIPLHGVETILRAARRLATDADIRFVLVGNGQLRKEMEALAHRWKLANVDFRDWVDTSLLGNLIRSADLALGIFGNTAKTSRVIPSKVFDICAAGAAFVTAATPAIQEAFCHGQNAFLVPAADAKSLAEAIRKLKTDPILSRTIAASAFHTGRVSFAARQIVRELVPWIHSRKLR